MKDDFFCDTELLFATCLERGQKRRRKPSKFDRFSAVQDVWKKRCDAESVDIDLQLIQVGLKAELQLKHTVSCDEVWALADKTVAEAPQIKSWYGGGKQIITSESLYDRIYRDVYSGLKKKILATQSDVLIYLPCLWESFSANALPKVGEFNHSPWKYRLSGLAVVPDIDPTHSEIVVIGKRRTAPSQRDTECQTTTSGCCELDRLQSGSCNHKVSLLEFVLELVARRVAFIYAFVKVVQIMLKRWDTCRSTIRPARQAVTLRTIKPCAP
ncbi:hypothetical protein [Deinococcus soli (ex Cha et al. 2016)]|uniref:Uncharacterized protein n=1 Tax=Deinococcus soli (ex Cha et al. 2016) TaxID=1309411 RepID=A0ACC6KNL6_9DEIO|nr:hypothetical protein [Deinococcus soli (ex Cha et al. 2016)]MDR6330646.1 hypothetical protein [Deinococcus soli (ex Cha et al. 2016)]MDR6754013.1 hypothetical protein [Deinococcus soli (ex Cha et al. 2016)]